MNPRNVNNNQPEFSLEKALQFVGDNSTYQKRRLSIICISILTFAILTCRLPLMNPNLNIAFLFASGLGQIVCPTYLSMKRLSYFLFASAVVGGILYPFTKIGFEISLLAMGFFGRGYFIKALIYLTQIGGDKFRSWSIIVVFALWGLSSFTLSLEHILNFSDAVWIYLIVLFPFCVGAYLTVTYLDETPLKLYYKKNFTEAKEVLNRMANQNRRPELPYGLEGQHQTDSLSNIAANQYNFMTLIANPVLKTITIPLLVLWIYREYIYYGTYIVVPQLGNQVSKNLILLSVSQTVAVLMSYPIKLRVKRVNAFFGFATVIGICSLLSSFTTLSEECMQSGYPCASKYLYRTSIMIIRFSISLIANILINYTLEIYPSNVRTLGFTMLLSASSLGSTILPWLVQSFIYIDISGFIGFAIATAVTLYYIIKLEETNGKMKTQNLEEMEKNIPMLSVQNWATLNFQ